MAISSWVGDPNGWERLTESIRVVVGKDGVNTDKKDPFHSVVNAFGTMIDHKDREVSTPWSKVLKFDLVTEPFRKDPSKRPGLGEVQTMIGLARYIFATAPQLLPSCSLASPLSCHDPLHSSGAPANHPTKLRSSRPRSKGKLKSKDGMGCARIWTSCGGWRHGDTRSYSTDR